MDLIEPLSDQARAQLEADRRIAEAISLEVAGGARMVILNARRLLSRGWLGRCTMAALVGQLYGIGHTHATRLCVSCGVDPNERVRPARVSRSAP